MNHEEEGIEKSPSDYFKNSKKEAMTKRVYDEP
jgi:hypothetical protein